MKQPKFLNLKTLEKLFCIVAFLSTTSCARTADDIDLSKEIPQERKMVPDTSIEERTVQLFSSLYESVLRNGEEPILSSLDSTDTDSPNTKLYLANFTNGGFMLFRDGGEEEMLLGWCDESDGKKGHYWVVDGLAQQMKKQYGYTLQSPFSERVPYETEIAIRNFVHCTWGWYGYKNGWFAPHVINDNNEVAELRSSHPNGEYYNISTFHIWK